MAEGEGVAEGAVVEFDPGAAKFGNFINYYRFNSVEDRIGALSGEFLKCFDVSATPILALDVGCNSGELTEALYELLSGCTMDTTLSHQKREVHVIAFDLDDALIERARANTRHPGHIRYVACDVVADRDAFHRHIRRFTEQFLRRGGGDDDEGGGLVSFDVGFCMSVTMWVHVHHGDDGLTDFLASLAALCRRLVVEPQPWKCYRTALRRARRNRGNADHPFPLLDGLTRDVQGLLDRTLLNGCGMRRGWKSLGVTCWSRPILLYEK